MANITISAVCNLACSYCFAGPMIEGASPDTAFIGIAEFEARLDFLDRSGIDQARLIGGEPTLHPRFPDLIRRARQRGKSVLVFTNGLMPARALTCLAALDPAVGTVVVNINAERPNDGLSGPQQRRRARALKRLGQRVVLGFNIVAPDFDPAYLLPLIDAAGCQRRIRLGLAHPVVHGHNRHLHPKQYPLVAPKIVRFAQQAAAAGVTVELDCGFVRCMFSDADLATLRQANVDPVWRCGPVPDIDISGGAIHCFPLARVHREPDGPAVGAGAIRDGLTAFLQPFRTAGIYRECSTCALKAQGECSGGCLANTIRRFRPASFHVAAGLQDAGTDMPPQPSDDTAPGHDAVLRQAREIIHV